ncbi:hypothetical protein Hanom_Chr07g00649631 [Helianthus anomalus]
MIQPVNLGLQIFVRTFVDSVYTSSFQYDCSNIVVPMKLPITHQRFNIVVAISLLQNR